MYYFAYGSNLNRSQMLERCPDCQPRLTATLPNYKLVFAGWSRLWRGGTASIKPFRGEKVLGAIYEISDPDLRRLDKYEGYPDTYDRLKITVYRETGEPVEAITYIKLSQSEETKPSPEYLAVLQQGYRDWELI
jgi:cation transport regulator ChaC